MSERPLSWAGVTGALIVALIGAAFFFTIIGVFGLVQALAALAAFFVLGLLIIRKPQAGDDRS